MPYPHPCEWVGVLFFFMPPEPPLPRPCERRGLFKGLFPLGFNSPLCPLPPPTSVPHPSAPHLGTPTPVPPSLRRCPRCLRTAPVPPSPLRPCPRTPTLHRRCPAAMPLPLPTTSAPLALYQRRHPLQCPLPLRAASAPPVPLSLSHFCTTLVSARACVVPCVAPISPPSPQIRAEEFVLCIF